MAVLFKEGVLFFQIPEVAVLADARAVSGRGCTPRPALISSSSTGLASWTLSRDQTACKQTGSPEARAHCRGCQTLSLLSAWTSRPGRAGLATLQPLLPNLPKSITLCTKQIGEPLFLCPSQTFAPALCLLRRLFPSILGPFITNLVLLPPHIDGNQLPERWDLTPSTFYPTQCPPPQARPINTYCPGLQMSRVFF